MIEPRELGPLERPAQSLAQLAPFQRPGEGRVEQAVAALGELPEALRWDIDNLASRFTAFMDVNAIRIRLEGVSTNACRKIHADHTDVRLITTYCGPGTEYVPDGASADEASLIAIPTGWIALFKGRDFHPDHPFCRHRSPPAADMGVQRLVLVIDTPLDPARLPHAPLEAPPC